MGIKLYNTANRRKEVFKPIEDRKVGMYVCGVTVYDLCHIGHARSAIVFDVLSRYLRAKGFDVTYVRNFTDIDDKIITRAHETGKDTDILALEYINAFYEDMERLYVLKADFEPRATRHIGGMIDMVKTLVEKGYAYVEGGDVFFSVEKFRDYGRLSGRKLDDMNAGSRIAVDKKKRHPMDFVLWKAAKPDEPKWQSPWGPGRPGWHLECAVMSNHYLGPSFDIHGGGKDLLFPHHENERAQSLCANGGIYAKYSIHNGYVTIESEKMSKSTGNFLTIRDALEIYHPQVLRLFLLSRHYRSPLDFSKKAVMSMQSGLIRIYRTLERLEELIGAFDGDISRAAGFPADISGDRQNGSFLEQFINTMDDDLNTAGAIGLIFDKVREMNKILNACGDSVDDTNRAKLDHDRRQIFLACSILGLLEETPADFFRQISGPTDRIDEAWIREMIKERSAARKQKEWNRADEIRDLLKQRGIVLEDGARGTIWRFDV